MKHLLLALLVLVVGFVVVACSATNSSEYHRIGTEYQFEEVVINGMDCVMLKNESSYGYVIVTFDCDWESK